MLKHEFIATVPMFTAIVFLKKTLFGNFDRLVSPQQYLTISRSTLGIYLSFFFFFFFFLSLCRNPFLVSSLLFFFFLFVVLLWVNNQNCPLALGLFLFWSLSFKKVKMWSLTFTFYYNSVTRGYAINGKPTWHMMCHIFYKWMTS